MLNATILSIGGVTVSTTGGLTGNLLNQIISAFGGASDSLVATTTVAGGVNNPTLPAPTQTALPNVLVIPSSDTGTISIPAGYAYVIYEGTGTLTGGQGTTAVLGTNLNYTGPAGTVLGTGGTESVTDSTAGGTFAFFEGSFSLNAAGGGDTVAVDSGASGEVTVSGSNTFLSLGTPSVGVTTVSALGAATTGGTDTTGSNTVIITGLNESTSISGETNLIFLTGTDSATQSGGSSTFVIGPTGILTLNATGGSQIVYGNAAGGEVINAGPSTEFVGAPSAPGSTFTGSAGGADTVFAGTSIMYDGSAAASTFFLGGTGAATVFAGTSATLFGGSGGGSYTAGTGGAFFWNFGGGTTDSILGGAASGSLTVFGSSNENVVVSQLGAASGGTYVAWGSSDTINAMDARGGNTFFVVDQTLTINGLPTNFSGNTTLVGSSEGSDTFAFFEEPGSTSAHTITIENWQATDNLAFDGFSATDLANAATDLAAAGGTGASITLSDNTTIKFVGTSPTHL